MKKIYPLLIALVLFSGSHSFAEATTYKVSDTAAYRLNGESVLYTMTFDWSFSGRDVLVPMFTTRGLAANEATSTLGFELLNASGLRTNNGVAAAIVLADAPVANGYYRFTPGHKASFTILGVYQHERNTGEYAFKISGFPFIIEKGSANITTALNEYELEDFITAAK